jgi:uncharacterized protein
MISTMALPLILHETARGTTLRVYVQPKASRNELVGIHEGTLKVRLTAPPVEGEANKECAKFLAKLLNIPKSRVEVVQGHKSRRKTILILGITGEELQNQLQQRGIM